MPTTRHIFVLSLVLLCGCSHTRQRSPNASGNEQSPTLLDEASARKDMAIRKRDAERDVPADEWHSGAMGRQNSSRSGREAKIAEELLLGVKPKLARMSARQLLHSLKTVPGPYGMESFGGVDYYLYQGGNWMIIDELKTRPRPELESLRRLADPSRIVWEGDQGPSESVKDILFYRILHDHLQ